METSSETSEAESGGQPQILPPKTRSCDDLVAAVLADSSGSNTRRLSDPNISSDPQSLLMSVRDGSVVGFQYLVFNLSNKCNQHHYLFWLLRFTLVVIFDFLCCCCSYTRTSVQDRVPLTCIVFFA